MKQVSRSDARQQPTLSISDYPELAAINLRMRKGIRTMRKKAILAGAVASSFLLAACGGGGGNAPAGEADGSDAGSGSGTLDVWVMGDSADDIQLIADQYAEETGTAVNLQSIPWSAAHDKLLTAVASGKGPDVVQMGTTFMPEMVDAGALLDLTDYTTSMPEFAPDQFFHGNVTTTEFDGKTYGIPWYTETRVLFYRTDLLESVGYPEAPATWEELSDAATKLGERGKDMYGLAVDGNEPTLGFMFARQNGSPLFNDEGLPVFNEPQFVEAIAYLDSFIQDGSAPAQDLGLDTSQTFGGDGPIPMFISGPWMIKAVSDFAEQEGIEGKWATAPLPAGPDNNMSLIGGSNLAIWNNSSKADEAAKFIAYMIKPESLLKYNETTGSLPAVVSAWDQEPLSSDVYLKAVKEQLGNAEPMPLIPEWDAITQRYLSAWEQISVGHADIQTTLDTLNDQAAALVESGK